MLPRGQRRSIVLGGVIAASLALAGTTYAAYSGFISVGNIEAIASPGGYAWAYGTGANGAGTVVGYAYVSNTGNGTPYGYRAIRSVNGGAWSELPVPAGYYTEAPDGYSHALAYGVAENGTVAGRIERYQLVQSCPTCGSYYQWRPQAVVWDASGAMTVLPSGGQLNGWEYSWAHAISNSGEYVVGQTYMASTGRYEYVRWRVGDAAPQVLSQPGSQWAYPHDVNDAGVAVGYEWIQAENRYRAVRWSADGSAREFLGELIPDAADNQYRFEIARAAAPDGGAVGSLYLDVDGSGPGGYREHAVRWAPDASATDISPAGASSASASDVNAAGLVLGMACAPGCANGIITDDAFHPLLGGGSAYHSLSESVGGEAWVAGAAWGGTHQGMARWRISTVAPNAAPTIAFATASVAIEEGSPVTLAPTAADADGPGPLSYEWDATDNGVDDFTAGGTTLTFIPDDDGTYAIRVRVSDGLGATSDVASILVVASNVAPTATFAATPTSLPEGGSFTIGLTNPNDPASPDRAAGFTYLLHCGIGAAPSGFGGASSQSCATTDDGVRTVAGSIRDKDDGTTTYEKSVTITNVAPTVTRLVLPAAPVAVGTSVAATAHYTDPGAGDTHSATFTWDWDIANAAPAATAATTSAAGSDGSATGTTAYSQPGVYTVRAVVADDDQGEGTRLSSADIPAYVVVYDPSAGFVTGGGWITSPAGACRWGGCTEATVGKATLGFVSRYRKGQTTPDGNAEFQFHAGGLLFKSAQYQWLVVSGARAQFKGEGTINGVGRYGFLLTAVDGQVAGGGGADRFRIKIWVINDDGTSGDVVYDNQMGAAEDSDATTALGGGSIVIHGN